MPNIRRSSPSNLGTNVEVKVLRPSDARFISAGKVLFFLHKGSILSWQGDLPEIWGMPQSVRAKWYTYLLRHLCFLADICRVSAKSAGDASVQYMNMLSRFCEHVECWNEYHVPWRYPEHMTSKLYRRQLPCHTWFLLSSLDTFDWCPIQITLGVNVCSGFPESWTKLELAKLPHSTGLDLARLVPRGRCWHPSRCFCIMILVGTVHSGIVVTLCVSHLHQGGGFERLGRKVTKYDKIIQKHFILTRSQNALFQACSKCRL